MNSAERDPDLPTVSISPNPTGKASALPTTAVPIPEETLMLVLDAAYPSPARDAVTIAYSVPEDGRVVLSVYDLSDRRVATLVDAEMTAGRHEVAWNCADVPSGVYLYRLETTAGALTRRLVVSR
jgi:hypothetical protein